MPISPVVKALVAHPAVTASKGCQDSGCSRVHVSGLPVTAGMLSLWRVVLGAVDAYTEARWMNFEQSRRGRPLRFPLSSESGFLFCGSFSLLCFGSSDRCLLSGDI